MDRRIIIIAIISLLFNACQKTQIGDDKHSQVYLSASVQEEPMTRAPYYSTEPSAGSPLEAAIWASTTRYIYPAGGSNGRTDGTVAVHTTARFQSAREQLIAGIYYNQDHITPVYFVGLHPASGWISNAENTVASFTFDGRQDVMFAPETTGQYPENGQKTVPALHFNHLLSQIRLSIQAESDAIAVAWGKINSIKLIDPNGDSNSRANINLNNGGVTFDTPSIDAYNFYSISSDAIFPGPQAYELKTEEEELAYVLCAPVTATEKDQYSISVVRTSEYIIRLECEYRQIDIPLDLMSAEETYYAGSTKGKQFNIRLMFKAGDTITVSAKITDWETGGIGIGKIEE